MDIKKRDDFVDVRQRVRAFVRTNYLVPETTLLGDDDSLLDRGIVYWSGVFELIDFVEATFGLAVDDSEMTPDNLDSIARVATYVSRRMREPALHPTGISVGEP